MWSSSHKPAQLQQRFRNKTAAAAIKQQQAAAAAAAVKPAVVAALHMAVAQRLQQQLHILLQLQRRPQLGLAAAA
jgi:hypothetical protein